MSGYIKSHVHHRRIFTQRTAMTLLATATLLVVIPIILILAYMIIQGYSVINWEFLSQMPSQAGKAGGILPAIVGTFYLMLGTILFALPIGVLAGIYLAEYARNNWLTRLINLAIINLAGVPSIVFGLFGLAVFVLALDFGMSILAASLTLAAQALAMTITTSREAINAVPTEYREGSLAIGVSKWQTIRHAVLPEASTGILTGAILAMSRAAGETAPILVVGAAFLVPGLPGSPLDRFMALPYHLYTVSAHVPGMPKEVMWGVALVLVAMVLFFNILVSIVRTKTRKR
ncbi:MAG: phosphate ABC transporter permease PstA [Dehalogenimonas sp.]|uniref:Phosphate transport system permease protein PstA n=1 Tax=Candidatus Dehalogenimonas loeffleri TaxID=3127115 RepID=A0ABZ2J573_9CHLR|nr:phosphate ABC transporter permease PstA [Dehalogenimonas sp.]